MNYIILKIKGLVYIVWQSRHMTYHVLIGIAWALLLQKLYGEFNYEWLFLGAIASILPDLEHLNYFLGYGKNEPYAKKVAALIKAYHCREVILYFSKGHKYNTSLAYHNLYSVGFLLVLIIIAWTQNWRVGLVVLGSFESHYVFDIVDDFVLLGKLNPNWMRWGRPHQS